MTRTAVVAGVAGGIGSVVRQQLEREGYRVIGIDLRDAEVIADLATHDGRLFALAAVSHLCDDRLDAFVYAAGLGGTERPASRIVAVNYFGAMALLDGLFPLLCAGHQSAAVVISSISGAGSHFCGHPLEQACLEGRELAAFACADGDRVGYGAYACSKRALALKVRELAVQWAQHRVRLNAVAPGPVDTPLHTAARNDPVLGAQVRDFVPPLGRIAAPLEIAQVIAFLLSAQAAMVHGNVMFVDGGMDAQLRPGIF